MNNLEIESININSGICAELSEVFDLSHYEISIIVGDIAENWSKFSGSRTFPVPHPMIDMVSRRIRKQQTRFVCVYS